MGSDKIKKKVFVAMSGGVDSSVAAYLLQRQGYQVTGVYMKNWSDPLADVCPWEQEVRDFRSVCKVLGIPHRIETFEEQYRKKVVEYLIKGYRRGITPNPDMLCNREIKFKLFLAKARYLGADYIATGHYVIKKQKAKGKTKSWILYQGRDKSKDQSYFLALLTQRQLRRALFPIGEYDKKTVRTIAKRARLPVYNKPDSQGICFIGRIKFSYFIRQYIPSKPGPVVTTDGQTIGQHDGLAYYTIGQRRGLGIGGGLPYYVVRRDIRQNRLVVGVGNKDKALFSKIVVLKGFNWISGGPPQLPFCCTARIRYRQPLQSCIVKKRGGRLVLYFKKSQRAVAAGQFAVLYQRGSILGGGMIV